MSVINYEKLYFLKCVQNLLNSKYSNSITGELVELIENNNKFFEFNEEYIQIFNRKSYEEISEKEKTLMKGLNKKQKNELILSELKKTVSNNISKLIKAPKSSLQKRFDVISQTFNLNKEEDKILNFIFRYENSKPIEDLWDKFSELITESKNCRFEKNPLFISVITGIDKNKVKKVLSSNSELYKSSILVNNGSSKCIEINEKISECICSNIKNKNDIQKTILGCCRKTELSLNDFSYLKKEKEIILNLLASTLSEKTKGVNVLLYGPPGTGKTEFSAAMSQELQCKIYSVGEADEGREPDRKTRLSSLNLAQSVLRNDEKTIILFDEAEDVLEGSFSFFGISVKNQNVSKIYCNRLIEENTTRSPRGSVD